MEAHSRGGEPAAGGELRYPSGDVRIGDGFRMSLEFLPAEISRSPWRPNTRVDAVGIEDEWTR
jgi:hypothetical protein